MKCTCIALAAAIVVAGCGRQASQTAPRVAPVVAQLSATPANYVAPTPDRIPEALPPLPAGDHIRVNLVLLDKTVAIAPDENYHAWTFNGTVPGPVIHARVGDTIDVTLTNKARIGHSIDFHAALAPADVAYQTIMPGQTLRFSWVAAYPGAFEYHCGTPPVLAHISNGMYGAIIVDPPGGWGAPATSYVLVQSEFYPAIVPGTLDQFAGDLAKMKSGVADVVTFNGKAFRYKDNPLAIVVDRPVRLFVVDAGPSHFSAFHVVGTIFSRVLMDGNPRNALYGIQTASIPPGGGAVVEFTPRQAGAYPFLSHSFGDADSGAMGTFAASD